jgi:hypothetical protein
LRRVRIEQIRRIEQPCKGAHVQIIEVIPARVEIRLKSG